MRVRRGLVHVNREMHEVLLAELGLAELENVIEVSHDIIARFALEELWRCGGDTFRQNHGILAYLAGRFPKPLDAVVHLGAVASVLDVLLVEVRLPIVDVLVAMLPRHPVVVVLHRPDSGCLDLLDANDSVTHDMPPSAYPLG